jgi:hypothetical protein
MTKPISLVTQVPDAKHQGKPRGVEENAPAESRQRHLLSGQGWPSASATLEAP